MAIKTIPLSYINQQWASKIGCKSQSALHGMSLLLFDGRLDGQAIDVRLPEAMGTLVDAPHTFRFTAGQKWKVSEDGNWSYDGTSLQRFNSEKEPGTFDGEVMCSTRLEDSTLTAELTLRNGSFTTWKSPYLWVCVMYAMAPAFDPKTLVLIDGKWVPYEETCGQFYGPAGMRTLTSKGLAEIERLQREGYTQNCPFRRDLIADGPRAACAQINEQDVSVIVKSEHAVLLGGYDKNPCTDMAIGFGDLEPGQRVSRKVEICLVDGL